MSSLLRAIAKLSPRLRRLDRLSLATMAMQVLLVAARVAEFALGAPAYMWEPTSLLMFAFAAAALWLTLRMRGVRLGEALARDVERAQLAKLRRLSAPNPRPGQCPVCSLEDLDEWAVGDELLGDAGTVLARVVAYGPWRAHAECAAVVPYAGSAAWKDRSDLEYDAARLAGSRLRLPSTGPHSEEAWARYGFEPREALLWYRSGFTPWHAQEYRKQWGSLSAVPVGDRHRWASRALEAQERDRDRLRG